MYKPPRTQFPLPQQTAGTWYEILSDPKDIAIDAFETGHLRISNHYFLNLKHPRARGIKKEIITVPVYCFLIRHRYHGDFLVDAGLDRSFQLHTHGNIQGILKKLLWPLEGFQKEGQDIASQLSEKGTELKGVFFTHLHSDHIAGMQHLPKNIRLVIGKGESHYSFGPFFYQDNFEGVETLYEIDFSQTRPIPPLGPCADIFGDGSFWAIHTPGHRRGHVSYLVNGKDQAVLITGDACDIKLGFDRAIGPGFGSYNISKAQQSLEKMIEFAGLYPQVSVFFGHEKP